MSPECPDAVPHGPHFRTDTEYSHHCGGRPVEGPETVGRFSPTRDEDNAYVRQLLRDNGMGGSGDYEPAHLLPDGRWSVDVSTLALLLQTFQDARRKARSPACPTGCDHGPDGGLCSEHGEVVFDGGCRCDE